MPTFLLVALAGAAGASARYGLDLAFSRDAHPLGQGLAGGPDGADDLGPSLAESQAILAARGEETAEDERLAARAENEFGQFSDGSEAVDFDPLLLAHVEATRRAQRRGARSLALSMGSRQPPYGGPSDSEPSAGGA